MVCRVTLIVALVAFNAAPLNGQVRVGLSAFLGGYLPGNNLFESVRLGDTDQPIILNLGHKPGIAGGGRLTVRLSKFALEAEAGYVVSDLDIPSAVADDVPGDASIFLGSLSVLYDIYRAPFSPLSIYLLGGGGLVARSGDFFDAAKWPTATVKVHEASRSGESERGNPRYAARFSLRIRDVVQTVTGEFEVTSESPLTVEGRLVLDRVDFGIGDPRSRWNPFSIRDEVPVEFTARIPDGD